MHDEAGMSGLATEPPPAANLRQCGRCTPGLFRRVNRISLLERTVLTWLGFYPWECVCCRRKRFFRDHGREVAREGSKSMT